MSLTPRHAARIPRIPQQIEDIDAAWLAEAIGTVHPGISVFDCKVLSSLGGACTKLRVALKTNDADFPTRLIVKGCFEPHNQGMRESQLYEVRAYQHVVQKTGVSAPRIYVADGDEERGAVLIMEDLDLRGVKCLKIQDPIGFDLAAQVLDLIARLHARWWDSPELAPGGAFAWTRGVPDPGPVRYLDIVADPAKAAPYLQAPRAAGAPRMFHDLDRIRRAFDAIYANPVNAPLVMNHGDVHLANLFVDSEGRPGLLDWLLRRCPWPFDVSYFICGALDICDRRRWEAPLLMYYLTRLEACGVTAPSFEDAWLAYRTWIVWGLLVWQFNSTDFHTEAAITAAAARFQTAIVDHDTFNLLGV